MFKRNDKVYISVILHGVIAFAAGILGLHSCTEHESQFVNYDYYQVRNDGDSMIIISFGKSIWIGKEEKDTTILYLDDGQFKLDDGSVFFSNKTDTSYIRKPIDAFQDEKQLISIKRKEGLNYTTLQTFWPMLEGCKTSYPYDKWKLISSITYIYDDILQLINILENGAWFFPAPLPSSTDGYILENKDKVYSYNNGKAMTIVFHHHQKDGQIKRDSLRLHLVNGEYLNEDNYLFLSSRDTTYMSHPKDENDTPFQMRIDYDHSKSQAYPRYSIYLGNLFADDDSEESPLNIQGIMMKLNASSITPLNRSWSFLYDEDYHIIGMEYGFLNFHQQCK